MAIVLVKDSRVTRDGSDKGLGRIVDQRWRCERAVRPSEGIPKGGTNVLTLSAPPGVFSERLTVSCRANPRLGRSQRIFDARSLLYFAKYFAARDCAPGPNTLAAALLPSSFRNTDFASFFSCSDTSA